MPPHRYERLPASCTPAAYTDIDSASTYPPTCPSSPSSRSRAQSQSYPSSTYQPSISSFSSLGSRTEVDSEGGGDDGISLWGGTSEPSTTSRDAVRAAARDELVIQLLTRVTQLEARLDAQDPQDKEELDLESQSLLQRRSNWTSPATRSNAIIIAAVMVMLFMFGFSGSLLLILMIRR